MNPYKRFNQSQLSNSDRHGVLWFDRTGILPIGRLNAETNGVITLIPDPYERPEQFIGYDVEIVNKKTGTIASHRFLFQDYELPRKVIIGKEQDTWSSAVNFPRTDLLSLDIFAYLDQWA